jgi:hypothetical protein
MGHGQPKALARSHIRSSSLSRPIPFGYHSTGMRQQETCDLWLAPHLPCPLDHLVGDGEGELATGDDVAAVVNARPDARLRGPRAECRERFGVTREEIAEHPGDGD